MIAHRDIDFLAARTKTNEYFMNDENEVHWPVDDISISTI